MKYETSLVLGTATILMGIMFASSSYADNKWGNYRTVERYDHRPTTKTYQYKDQYGRSMTQEVPVRPQYRPNYSNHYPSYPNYGNYDYRNDGRYDRRYDGRRDDPRYSYPNYPRQNGITIIYNQDFPTDPHYSYRSQGYVNGTGSIQSSRYTLISDWRRYGLPAPSVGMHWIYQDGRYLQMSND